ncbi:MAG: hypothetical protein K0U79_14655 [Gammaproteobacteria bacterium]|nr:hypothetical protein [Gammaproteobacteria bacterium]
MNTELPPTAPDLFPIVELPGVFADALLRDERCGLLFCSLWGRDTAIQELLARLSVPVEEGGLRFLHVEGPQGTETVHFDRMPTTDKLSGRLPPKNLFGNLVQLWLYDRLAVEPDRANRRALLLQRNALHGEAALWNLVRSVTHLPLLDHWNEVVLDVFRQNDWIRPLRGIQVDAAFVDLGSDAVEVEISRLVREGRLTLDTDQPASLRQAA